MEQDDESFPGSLRINVNLPDEKFPRQMNEGSFPGFDTYSAQLKCQKLEVNLGLAGRERR